MLPHVFDTHIFVLGLYNIAILVGAFIGLFTAGPLSDWVSDRATRKNNGVREPEMRLPAMIPYVIIMIIGNVVVACGYNYHWNWAVIVCIGYACAGIQVAALPAISSTYAVDSYKPVAGSLFVSITVNKVCHGTGFSSEILFHVLTFDIERLGLWFLEIHHALDRRIRIHSSNHDEHGFDYFVVSVRNIVLLQGKDVPQVDQGQQCPQDVDATFV